MTAGQLALAWVQAQGDDVVPIPGTKRVRYLEENVQADRVRLTDEDLAALDAAVPRGRSRGRPLPRHVEHRRLTAALRQLACRATPVGTDIV